MSLRSSPLLLIISVWNAITYLATSSGTSLAGGMDYLKLKNKLLNSGSQVGLKHKDLLGKSSFHQSNFTFF